MPGDLKSLSISDLFSKLHRMISDFIETIDETIRDNRQIGLDDIKSLRAHITSRLQKNEDIEENKKLLKVLDLFATNKAVMELIRADADDWLDFLEAIKKRLEQKGDESDLTREELQDIEKAKKLTQEIRAMIRK